MTVVKTAERRRERIKVTNYERPVVLANEDVAEGVYAASGAPAGSVSVSGVELTSAGSQYNKVNTYKVTIKNSGSEESTDWSVNISVTSGTATGAQVYNGWLASASLSGSTITITPGGGGAIPVGEKITVEVVVSYSSDSVEVK
ncbi:MAG: cellulose-binding domain-containing protein [Firmicutes bacterium]|nr:cellulose-binding domain-containing protein [Bacillota bacterium]